MLFAGKTKSGSHHLWPRWWVFLFGGNFKQKNGGYGRCYSILSRIRRYYREEWHKHCSLIEWIWTQGPYGLVYFKEYSLKNQYKPPIETDVSENQCLTFENEMADLGLYYLDCFTDSNKQFPTNTYYDADPKSLAEVGADLLLRKISGITSFTISKETRGMSPIRLIHKVIERPIR